MKPSQVSPKSQTTDTPPISPEMQKAAEGLEAVFTQEMLKAMRNTVNGPGEASEFSLHNSATDIYQGMLDQEYSDLSARMNSLGLSKQIVDYWLRSQQNPQYNESRHSQPVKSAAKTEIGRTGGTHEGQSDE